MEIKAIEIFTDITTEEVLKELEAEAEKYDGLYVDMEDKPQRKYVKDKASLISGLLKTLDRARIDESKNYKTLVEAEADSIKARLEAANKPFTLLMDEHKIKRAKELAEKKEFEDAKALFVQIGADHEAAIMEDKVRTFEKAEAEKKASERLEAENAEAAYLAKVAAELAAQELIERAENEKKEAVEREKEAGKQVKESERLRLEAVENQKASDRLAEERRVEAEKQAKIDKEKAAEDARLAEVARQEQEVALALAEQKKREANKKHKGAINRGIVDVLVANDVSEADAKKFVTLAATLKLPNLTINY